MSRLDNPEIHSRIEKLRTDLGMTQPEFAAALGMDPKKGRSTINNWETRANKVKDDDLKKINKGVMNPGEIHDRTSVNPYTLCWSSNGDKCW